MPEIPMVDLVGVGLNAMDTLIPLPAYPAPGSKTEYTAADVLPGGQVATTVLACQLWGLQTRYVGKLGKDDHARRHREAFAQAGVETRLIEVPGASSPQSLIMVDSTGERTILCRRDDRVILQPEDLQRDWIINARALHVDGHDTPAATLAATWAREAGIPVIADLDDIYPGMEALLATIDYLIVSRDLPGRLTGEPDLERALRTMQTRYGCALAAATLGEEGVLAWDGKQFHAAAAYCVPVADTTGAGDIFHAGFIYGLLGGWPLPQMLDFACAAAAMNCTQVGARGGIAEVPAIHELTRVGSQHHTAASRQISRASL